MARLDIINCGIEKGELTGNDKLSGCRDYVDQHIHKLYAFQDIRRLLDDEEDDMKKILEYIRDNKEGSKVNSHAQSILV